MKLLKNATIYAPQYLGKKDLLLASDKIVLIDDDLSAYQSHKEIECYDLSDKIIVPGYIDNHVHITGGGMEQGYNSRVIESFLSAFTTCGVTSVVGLLGTDGITRNMESLIAKAKALKMEGLSVYALCGSYAYPPKTLTDDIEKDILMIEEVIGVKCAMSDHRSSNITSSQLIEIGAKAYRAGMLSNKAGIVTIHMGDGKKGLACLFEALENCDLPARVFLPTHMLRNDKLIKEGQKLISLGGNIDCTISDKEDMEKLLSIINDDSIDHISISSDAFGSMPKFDKDGNCIGLTYANCSYLHQTIKYLANEIGLEKALKLLTVNPARILKLSNKGKIMAGYDSDLLVLDSKLDIESVLLKGKWAIYDHKIMLKGKFE